MAPRDREQAPWPGMGGGWGCVPVMHGRSRMTIDPRIPTMPVGSTSGFDRPSRHCFEGGRTAAIHRFLGHVYSLLVYGE